MKQSHFELYQQQSIQHRQVAIKELQQVLKAALNLPIDAEVGNAETIINSIVQSSIFGTLSVIAKAGETENK